MTEQAYSLAIEEYKALRATIRERGSLRCLVAAITFLGWAAAVIGVAAYVVSPFFGLVPLMVLAGGFEVVFALHVGVERIGRFVQLRYESADGAGPAWEHTAMSLRVSSGGVHALFVPAFLAAAALNWLLGLALMLGTASPEEFGGLWPEVLLFGSFHAVVIVRWFVASRFARSQRVRDLDSFARVAEAASVPRVARDSPGH